MQTMVFCFTILPLSDDFLSELNVNVINLNSATL